MNRKGIVLAGGASTRLRPMTDAFSKQLVPVYDKPMIYYPISTLMLSGIREILLITTPSDSDLFKRLLGDGSRFGISLTYAVQDQPNGLAQALIIGEAFLANSPSVLVLGDTLLYGHGLSEMLLKAGNDASGAIIFACRVDDPSRYGVVTLDSLGAPTGLEEKPKRASSNLAVPGLYFYDSDGPTLAKALVPSQRGELEITDLNRLYMEAGKLSVVQLGRGTTWLDMGTNSSLLDAGNFVETIQKRQGLYIACLEEIAYRNGWISRDQLIASATGTNANSEYGQYIYKLLTTADF